MIGKFSQEFSRAGYMRTRVRRVCAIKV